MHFGELLMYWAKKSPGAMSNIKREGPKGMTHEEIEEVMRAQGVTFLPRIYREYLETMGRHPVLFRGEQTDIGLLLEAKRMCQHRAELEGETYDFTSTFIWHTHVLTWFSLFFVEPEDENPIVYVYEPGLGVSDGRGGFWQTTERLREMLLWEVRPSGFNGDYSIFDRIDDENT